MGKKKDSNYIDIKREISTLPTEKKSYNLRKKVRINNPNVNVKQEVEVNKNKEESQEYCLINKLNDDCLSSILQWLSITERIQSERVCKRWQIVSKLSWATYKHLDLQVGNLDNKGFLNIKLNIKILRQVLLRCGFYLHSIEIKDPGHELTKSALSIIARLCPNIKVIDIKDVKISNSGVSLLSKNCKNIEKLSLGNCRDIRETELGNLLANNQNLRCLKLFKLHISDNCLLSLPFDKVEELVFEDCRGSYRNNLIQILPQLEKLKVLEINKDDSFPNNLPFLNKPSLIGFCKNLNTLSLSDVTKSPLVTLNLLTESFITDLKNLTELNISENSTVNDEFLKNICKKCKQLLSINISSCQSVTDIGLTAITSLPKLEILNVNYLSNITSEKFRFFPNLKTLECRSCIKVISEDLVTLLEVSPNMQSLDVSDCEKLTNSFINSVKQIKLRNKTCFLTIYVQLTNITDYTDNEYLRVCNKNPKHCHEKIIRNHFNRDLMRRFEDNQIDLDYYDSSDDNMDALDLEDDFDYDDGMDFFPYRFGYDEDDEDEDDYPAMHYWY